MKINAATITEPGKVEFRELTTPELKDKEILVRVHAIALCTLEQRIFKGEVKMPFPCIGGHEVSGEIAELGPGIDCGCWKVGDRVAVRLLYNCGECYQCRSGHSNLCCHSKHKPVREGFLPGPGGACDYIIVQPTALFPIPDDLPYEQAALTEPLACVVHSINRAGILLGDTVAILGGGVMGQFHTMLAKKKGARVIVSEPDEARRALALKNGADIVIDPSVCDPAEEVRRLTSGTGAEVVFNTTQVAEVFVTALNMVAKRGTVVQYSSVHPDTPVPVSPHLIHNNEITITGSISPMVEDFYTANRLLSSHIIDCSGLIEKTIPFDAAQTAFEESIKPGTFRVIITK